MTKNDILEYFKDINYVYNNSNQLDTLSSMIDELLKEQAEIVRCKDCKYSIDYSAVFQVRPYKCEKHIWSREADWFCADGERQGDNE